jgi:hypothetical protein
MVGFLGELGPHGWTKISASLSSAATRVLVSGLKVAVRIWAISAGDAMAVEMKKQWHREAVPRNALASHEARAGRVSYVTQYTVPGLGPGLAFDL